MTSMYRQGFKEESIVPGTIAYKELCRILGKVKPTKRYSTRKTISPPCDRCQSKPATDFISIAVEGINEITIQVCHKCVFDIQQSNDIEKEIAEILNRWEAMSAGITPIPCEFSEEKDTKETCLACTYGTTHGD